ncbi:recombinase family protein [Mycobacterium marinum]|uniref:recombinase family protein n=1 Tax=Mycobacterium marinum TaxID=1781 RepID=UPI003566D45C
MRALIVIRLSRVTDATTSPERQLAECRSVCAQRGYEVVGVAEDLDVSGAVDPFDRKKRPNLARWLAGEQLDANGHPASFDAIVTWRVDRLTRSIRHLRQLVDWAEDNGKLVVSATEPHFDMASPFAAVLIALLGTVAEMELQAIKERTRSAAQHNIKAGKYRGSTPPWGYLPDDSTGEWRLAPDADQVEVIHEVVRRVLDDKEPLQRIAHDLTRRGVLTPKDDFARIRGRKIAGREWSVTTLKRSLLSEAMLGYAVSNGKAVRNDDGSPVLRSEPIIRREDFEALRVELAGRSKRGEPTTRSTSLLLRVIHCGVCGQPGYKFNGGSHSQFPRYRCKSMTKASKCGNRTIRMDEADAAVERIILALLGESERLERVWDAGEDNSAELAEINDVLSDLTSLIGTDVYRAGTPQRAQLDARIAGYAARQAELSAEAVTPARWKWKPTGEKFGDWWAEQDVIGRNVWLRSMKVRLEFQPEGLRLDVGDLFKLTEQLEATGPVAEWQSVLTALREAGAQGITVGPDGAATVTD